MTDFKRHDSTAYADDQPLDTFLLVRNNDNFEAVREKRGRMAAWTPGTLDSSSGAVLKVQVSGFVQRSLIPYLWHLTADTTQISVAVRHRVTSNVAASGSEVTLSTFAVSLPQFLSGAPLPAGTSTGLSGGASSSTTTTHTIDTSELSEGWIVVCVGILSGESADVEITGTGGVTGEAVYTGYYPGLHICNSQATPLGTTGSVIHHWGLRVKSGVSAKASETIPQRQLLVLEYDNAIDTDYTYRLHAYPTIDVFPSDSQIGIQRHLDTDALWYVELGFADIESVTIYDSAVRARALGGRLDAGLPARAPALIEEVGAQNRWWLTTGRVHHMGGCQSPSDVDFTTTGPANRISGSRFLSASYQEIAACTVGTDDLFEQASTNYQRTTISVKALMLLTHTTNTVNADTSVFDLFWRLQLTDLDGSSNAVVADVTSPNVRALTCPTFAFLDSTFPAASEGMGNTNAGLYPSIAYLFGFGPNGNYDGLKRHALRGVLPEAELGRSSLYEVDLSIRDTQTTRRRLSVQCKSSLTQSSGRVTRAFPRLHLLTWTAVSTPYTEEPTALTLGAT